MRQTEEAAVLRCTQGTSLPTEQGPEHGSDTQEVVSHTLTHETSVHLLAWIHAYSICVFSCCGTHTISHRHASVT